VEPTILYHYAVEEKFKRVIKQQALLPSAPFNSRISETDWQTYSHTFLFSVARLNICCFLELVPESWMEYGLFKLLMKEFAGGDHLLKITVSDDEKFPILVRDHSFHSPKKYGMKPTTWSERKNRDSRPDLREKWYRSTTLLSNYNGSFICPEVLIPFSVPLVNIKILGE